MLDYPLDHKIHPRSKVRKGSDPIHNRDVASKPTNYEKHPEEAHDKGKQDHSRPHPRSKVRKGSDPIHNHDVASKYTNREKHPDEAHGKGKPEYHNNNNSD